MSLKVGEPIVYVGEVREDGVLQDISAWPITAQARKDSVDGALLGNFTRSDPSLGIFKLTLASDGFSPCLVYTDVRIEKPDGTICFTDTDKFPLLKSVTEVTPP